MTSRDQQFAAAEEWWTQSTIGLRVATDHLIRTEAFDPNDPLWSLLLCSAGWRAQA